jgi:protein Tob/BTG
MYEQISAAVLFLVSLIKGNSKYTEENIQHFKAHLMKSLVQRYENHWFPDKPSKGQAYRSIRVNMQSPRDPILERAATECGLRYESLKLPLELTIWIDPDEVSYR